mgnify:FL=1
MLLHTLNSSPQSVAARDCCTLLTGEDTVILFGDGVYAGLEGSAISQLLRDSGAAIFALAPDVDAAGIGTKLAAGISLIDYPEFVAISAQYPRQMAWY